MVQWNAALLCDALEVLVPKMIAEVHIIISTLFFYLIHIYFRLKISLANVFPAVGDSSYISSGLSCNDSLLVPLISLGRVKCLRFFQLW